MDYSDFKVLIVDDNTTNIQVVGTHLKELKADISIATNGLSAIEISKRIEPDLILLDIMMPEMDGFQVFQELKKHEKTSKIPVIFLTAKIGTEDIVKAFELGAVDYITKPFKAPELIARVKTQLNIVKYLKTLEKQKTQLEKLNQDKSEFLSIAAHDLKNPINTMTMLGKILRDTEDLTRDEVVEFAQDIITSSSKMFQLISELLNVNLIEEGKVTLRKEMIDPASLVREMISNYKLQCEEKNLEIELNDKTDDAYIYTDLNAITQVLDNLISNAVKYSPFDKKVFIDLVKVDNNIQIIVKDQGQGFTEDDKSKLFTKFAKLSARPTNNENSTGLGLSIVKRYLDLMDATIILDSDYKDGACFIVEHPIANEINE